jgi:ribosomal protein L11 methyltransferase
MKGMVLAPRIRLYAAGSPCPQLEAGWIALAQHQVGTELPPHGVRSHSGAAVFGDGSHPTTRLCAAVLDQLCRHRQPHAVLDVGTGTGVLARIARARGATFVVGTDIDAEALAAAAANAALDAHPITIVLSAEAPDHWGARFDVVIANILEEPLRTLAPALGRALAAQGMLAISGFTRVQVPAMRVHYQCTGLDVIGHAHLEEWALLLLAAGTVSTAGRETPGL